MIEIDIVYEGIWYNMNCQDGQKQIRRNEHFLKLSDFKIKQH